jgi:hypothetical protein
VISAAPALNTNASSAAETLAKGRRITMNLELAHKIAAEGEYTPGPDEFADLDELERAGFIRMPSRLQHRRTAHARQGSSFGAIGPERNHGGDCP